MENELDIQGTVLSFITKDGKIVFDENNLKRENKLIYVEMFNKKGEKKRAFLGENLSKEVRAKRITAGNLMTFDYGIGANDALWIVQPAGRKIEVSAKDATIKEVTYDEEIDVEDYIAL